MHPAIPLTPPTFQFDYELTEGIFLERPNRFISVLEVPTPRGNPQIVRAHVPDPGRLKELLLPGARVLVRDFGAESIRKLRYSLEMVYSQSGHLVSLNTQLPNRLVNRLLSDGQLPGFEAYRLVKREFLYGTSRIDFLLAPPQSSIHHPQGCLLEVKSCTLVEEVPVSKGSSIQRLALFPDAPSERGARHLEELITATHHGFESRVLILIQRGDADAFAPNGKTDPRFTAVFNQARQTAGLTIHALCFEMTPTGCRFVKEVVVADAPQT